jgi:hypothetical protein
MVGSWVGDGEGSSVDGFWGKDVGLSAGVAVGSSRGSDGSLVGIVVGGTLGASATFPSFVGMGEGGVEGNALPIVEGISLR